MVKLGIIGAGQQGNFYIKLLTGTMDIPGLTTKPLEDVVLHAVCDIDDKKIKALNEKHPEVKTYSTYLDMLDNSGIDAVMVVTPHYFHPEMAIEAMKRDIHVMVDKPAGVYTKQVREMNEFAVTKPNLKYAMMFNQRVNPLYQKVKELMEADTVGELRYSDWTITTWWRPDAYYNLSDWRATWKGEGGGVLINQAPHQIDLWQWLCGKPSKLFAKAFYGSHRKINVEDDVVALATYPNGATGVFRTCTHDIIGSDHLEILGDKGKIIIEGSKKLTIKRLKESETELNAKTTFEDVVKLFSGQGPKDLVTEEVLEFGDVWGEQHRNVLQNFIHSIVKGDELVAPGCEGIHALGITNAMHLSSWLNKEVELPVDEEVYFKELQEKIKEEN